MDLDGLKYLLEALRTPAASASTNIQSGPNPRTVTPNQNLGPIEQRRDGYRLYQQEKSANGESPVSYEEWLSTQE